MWIYEQEKTEENLSLLPQTVSLPVQKAEPALPTVPETAPEPVEQLPSKEPCIPAKRHATRDCWLLAAAFLLGSSAAGVLQAVCDAQQAELLRYYLEAWQGLFAPGSMQGTVQLFSMEYLALGLVVSLFLVLGLSALGPIMIFGSMMLYGLGSGLLMVQLCTAGGWKTVLLALLWTGLPAAAASGCLCFFGACALQVSSRIRLFLPQAFRWTSPPRGAGTAGAVSADHGGTAAAVRCGGRAFVSGQPPVNSILFLRVLVQCVTITKDHK